jgi:hypothetical protein
MLGERDIQQLYTGIGTDKSALRHNSRIRWVGKCIAPWAHGCVDSLGSTRIHVRNGQTDEL